MTETRNAVAVRDWSVEALVRIVVDHGSASIDPMLTRRFRAGEELVMVQWGLAGKPVERDAWWTSFDVDGAFIVPAAKVEVVRFLHAACPQCPHSAAGHDELGCLVDCDCCEHWGGLPAPRDDAELVDRIGMEEGGR